jgi:hypothetical protein
MKNTTQKDEVRAYLKTVVWGLAVSVGLLVFFGIRALIERGGV